ncbi:hypothetical protein PLESTB_001092900 [Pleodorina starrii]|uniref:Protein kinase domain-containing protein n=1 Tax=Pleodorina starrii TaxID=330485 RepID=A0A9W6BQD4_9CHLO|nr:hypothetical protein PLESTB_001092900 [Pleodorina starrii]
MGLFSCLVPGQGRKPPDEASSSTQQSKVGQGEKFAVPMPAPKVLEADCVSSAAAPVPVVRSADVRVGPGNEAFLRLVHLLSTAEGGWWSALSEGCQALCECLGAAHACVYVISTADYWATTAACAGLGAAAAAGRAYSSDPRFNGSAPAALLRSRKECPPQSLLFRSLGGSAIPSAAVTTAAAAPAGGAAAGAGSAGAGLGGLSSYCSGDTSTASRCPSPSQGVGVGAGVGVGVIVGGAVSGPDPDLPGDWQLLAEEHGLTQFAGVLWTTDAGEPLGVLSLAAKGPCRPSSWTPEALHSAVGLMAPHIRRAQAVLASPALSQLHAAATFRDLVNAVAEAAVEAAAAVAYVRGQSRVAFMGESLAAAAVFQQQPTQTPEGGDPLASVPLLKVRRSSCDFVLMPASVLRKSATTTTFARMSMDALPTTATTTTTNTAAGTTTPAGEGGGGGADPRDGREPRERGGTLTDGLKRESWNQRPASYANAVMATFSHANASNCNASFTLSFPRRNPCKGHTLLLHRTLLDEALSKQVAGLCIDDCQAYTVSMKAYPRDLILSRGAVMPLSLALATTVEQDSFRPRMALYVTYGTCLPRPALQAVVQELQQLLLAIMPIVKAKVDGAVGPEYEYLASQLQDANRLRGNNPRYPGLPAGLPTVEPLDEQYDGGGPEEQRALSFILPPEAPPPLQLLTPSLRGGAGGNEQPASVCALLTPTAPAQAQTPRPGGGSPPPLQMAAAAAAAAAAVPAAAGTAAAAAAPPPLLSLAHLTGGGSQRPTGQSNASAAASDPAAGGGGGGGGAREPLEGDIDMDFGSRRRGSAVLLGRLMGMQAPAATSELNYRAQSASETESPQSGRRISELATRSVSFHLEAAQVPRGASKLAPIIASMHDRLKAAQAVQMTNSNRYEARRQDLQSIKLLQEIGQGGYGTVYRGTYHGTEVAVKIIKQSRLAGVQSSSNVLASGTGLGLHKQNLHDAIELVASVSMSHINIVQVPAYFMDVRLEKPEDGWGEQGDGPSDSRPFRLRHSPSLTESPKAGQELHSACGEGAMALVLEYCDCGSLCDAILNRKFIERVTPKKPPAGANGSAPPKTYLAINMRSVYATLLEIALALRHMHSLALVHCDLKPQNVLLKSSPRDPRGFTAKLSDFGLAKMMAHDDEGQLIIDEAVASGTITHVAPEVLLGQKALGAAVDIYAFGILMYQLLCGVKVYDKMKSASVIANAVAHRFMRPQLPSWVPSSYRSLAEACWSHKPSARPTADELVRHLEQAIESKRAAGSARGNNNNNGNNNGNNGNNNGTSSQQQQQ